MLAPLSWLREYVEIVLPVEELAERLTLAGLELSSIESIGAWWDPQTLVVGQVVAVLPHPNADRLVLVDVDFGAGESQRVVTGAPNLFAYRGQSLAATTLPVLKVAFARTRAVLVDAYSDATPRPMKELKPAKIRGVESAGMVCSERELGLSEEHEGIILLPVDAPVGLPLREYLGDTVLQIDLTPDMARCLSMIGVAREVAALTGGTLHLPPDEWQPSGSDTIGDYVDVKIDDPQLCSRYTGCVIVDVTIEPSPAWMQERLKKAGIRAINNVVDITNYVMLEWGQPLHAFDYDILAARARRVGSAKPTIIVRRAQAGAKFTTLDNNVRELDDQMLMIADTAGDVALAGVMGGLESEVSAQTRNILLESATFEGINTRRTAQQLRMNSEASYRFARGIPPTLNPLAARRAAELIRRYAGGRIVPGIADAYPVHQPRVLAYTTESDMRRLLGIPVAMAEVEEALRRLDFEVRRVESVAPDANAEAAFGLHRAAGETLLECVPPWYRLDVRIPADLTEEVARLIGYARMGTTLMAEEMPVQQRLDVWQTEERIRDILVAAGLQETINRTLTTPEEHDKLRLTADDAKPRYIEISNPSSPGRRVMRRALLVSALENLVRNLRFAERMTTFEVGRVYLPEAGDGVLPLEDRRLSLALCGPRQLQDIHAQSTEAMDFFDLKGIVETLFDRLGFRPGTVEYRAAPDVAPFGPRCAEVWVGGEKIGLFGEVHPRVRVAFGLPNSRVVAAELRIEPLVRPAWQLQPMGAISNYPPVVEDLAFEVDESVTAQQIEDAMRQAGKALLVRVALFDVYRGAPLAVGRKSLAYRLTYQSPERALNEHEVTQLRQRIVAAVERATGGRLRS